jgi:hypothetical protein
LTSYIDPEYLELMPSYVMIARYLGEDAWGNNTFGAAESIRCRIDSSALASGGGPVRGGTVVTPARQTNTIYADYTEPPFTVRDKITMPDLRTPRITSVNVEYDERGPHHQVIVCEETRE